MFFMPLSTLPLARFQCLADQTIAWSEDPHALYIPPPTLPLPRTVDETGPGCTPKMPKTTDMWYVLDTPADLRKRTESPVSDVKITRNTELEAPSEVEEESKEVSASIC